jgi:hypothetical protein
MTCVGRLEPCDSADHGPWHIDDRLVGLKVTSLLNQPDNFWEDPEWQG